MKKIKRKSATGQVATFKFRNHALVSALAAIGLISALPTLAASLPTPCAGGCGASANLSFVQAGSATASTIGTAMTINQTSQTAILNWRNFDIARGNSVNFVQPGSTASALNRIWDANPSTIAGSLTANGQLYLVNQSGIVFANGAQVNTGALIASSLDISDSLFQAGYMTNTRVIPAFGDGINGIHGFVQVDTGAVLNGSRIMLFAPVVENKGSISTTSGQVVMAAGHKVYLEASRDPNLVGVLVEVDLNPGTQGVADTALAANAKAANVVLQHAEAGMVTNAKDIIAERGNVTLAGFAVNQSGRISATTSVTENGSIKLLARYNVSTDAAATLNTKLGEEYSVTINDIRATQTGKVTLAAGSTTAVTPELTDNATTVDGARFNPSIVEVMGNTIDMQSGSQIIVPGGSVTLAAISSFDPVLRTGLNPVAGLATSAYQAYYKDTPYSSFLNPNYKPAPSATDTARVFLDSGSSIDVSGSTASVSVARNILTVQLRGSQLADSPVQRTDRFLWGKDVQIDIRKGTALATYAAEESQIGRTVAERTASGGSVKLVSTGDVVMKSGAKVDISGGQIDYTGANIKTTTLVSDGIVYDMANAAPDRIFQAVSGSYTVEHKKWGVTETFNTMAGDPRHSAYWDYSTRWDPGYVEGKSAGTLTVLANHAVLDGDIVARTVTGSYQRQPYDDPATLAAKNYANNYKNTWQMMAQGGSLLIGDNNAVADSANSGLTNYIVNSNVTIQSGVTRLANNFTLFDPVNIQDILLDANLFSGASGLNRLGVYSNKSVSVAAGTALKLAPGGAITLQGGTVNMLGSIDAPSGTVKLGTAVTDPVGLLPGALNVGAAGAGSYISTRGQWVNDSTQLGVPDWSKPLLVNGGSIELSSGGDLLVASGTRLDASGGAWLDMKGKYTGGNGGNITMSSGKPQGAPFIAQLDGLDLRSYGTAGGKGGALTIKAAGIVLGGAAANGELALSAAFFQNGGFGSYNLSAQGSGLTVSAGALIEPKAKSLILDRSASLRSSGSDVTSFANPGLLPDWQRKPASITLNASNGGTLKVEAGAVIRVEPTASINLSASNQLTVLGVLEARAGSINLSLSKLDAYIPSQSIWLGSQSKLLSQGYFLKAQPNAQNLTQGQVLSGGKIDISANTGYVIAQQGSVMDVSGAAADIVLSQIVSGGMAYRASHVAGDAGSISAQTSAGGFFDGSMKAGVEVGSQAAAGKFSLALNNSSGIANLSNNSGMFPQVPAQMQVMASGNGGFATQAGLISGSDAGAGLTALDALAGKVLVDASALQSSGFDQVSLKSETSIALADQVNLQTRRSLMLDTPQLLSNGNSTLTSAQLTLGNFDQTRQALLDPLDPLQQFKLNPAAGAGVLNLSGQMVDLTGNFLVSGISQLNVNSNSDIRLNGIVADTRAGGVGAMDLTNVSLQGSLHTQGNVSLRADQVYPSTLAQFNLSVEDNLGVPAGSITVLPGQHSSSAVMSAGGQLTLSAADIVQNGVVKAPTGTVNLNGSQSVTLGAGSLTSVSADGAIVPFGLIQGGNAWVYDLTGAGAYVVNVAAPPQKQVKFTAPNINVRNGATVNLSGGGDLYAHEFFAGSGGSMNVLDPVKAAANTFAIIPGISGYSPYDPQYAGQYNQAGSKTTLQPGASVYLAGGASLKAGYYTLLPASYALLPNAYRVTAVSGYTDRWPTQGATALVDGTQIMAGKFAVLGTNIEDARYSGFAVTPSAVVRTQSEFHDSYANQFFTTQAVANGTTVPRLATDAGQLVVSAVGTGATLALDGIINAAPGAGGRGALVDLNGPGFDIVNTAGPATGRVQLTSAALNKLGAESLLIGGVRTQSTTGMSIAVGASDVVVDNAGSVLSGPEIILAANNAVTVKAGSDIEGKGMISGQAGNIDIGSATVNGDGALLRVSSAPQATVTRTNLAGSVATLTVENGATIGAQNSVLLDSSYATTVGNSAILKGQSLSVAAQNIDIGTNPAPAATSLALSGVLLTQALTFKDLTLHSYNDLNFYGTSSLGGLDANQQHLLNNLVLNSRSLNGVLNDAGQTNVIDATNVTLLNNNTGTSAGPVFGTGNLKINAEQIMLADGNKSIQGFDTVTLAAARQIVAQGTSNITLAAGDANVHNLVLQAGQITGTNKSNLTITANNDDIFIQPVAGASVTAGEALNAKLTIVGKSIADNGVIDLPAGSVTLHATGTVANDGTTLGNGAGVTLGNGSKTAAAGVSKTIAGQDAYAQAGSVSLISDNGWIDIQSGAVVDVSGAAGGGDAGSLNVSATKGAVLVAGNLKGAAEAKFSQGSFTLDASSLTGTGRALTGLNDTLTAGGFTSLRDMRVRTGNLVLEADVPGSIRARAQTFRLTADDATAGNGNIVVNGTIDSSGNSGGNIFLAAKNDLTLNALLDAHATGAGQQGGKVTLETTAGMIDLKNQLIDVHGSGNTGGSVLLRAPRNVANTDVALNNTGGGKFNASAGVNITVEAFKSYTSATGTLGANDVAATSAYKTDATNFAANAAAIKTRLGMWKLDPITGLPLPGTVDSNQHLTPGVQIYSATNLTLSKDWDLSTWRFNDGSGALTEAGILTLRATGNLQFGTTVGTTNTTASLTDGVPFATTNNTFGIKATGGPATGVAFVNPMAGPSWSYRLVSGADSSSADVMAVKSAVPAGGGTPTTGNFTLVAGKEATTGSGTQAVTTYTMEQIRTGTGFIDIAAGGNFNLNSKYSVIYTFGQPKAGVPVTGANTNNKYFGEKGGDITILAKGDINGAATDQLVNDWLWRQGLPNADGSINTAKPLPAWWINLQSFRQNVGALGGGNVSVTAGGNINTLSAVAPSTGYVDMVDPTHPTVVMGGGDLSVKAGGNINSGVFYVGNGLGSVRAGGSLGTNRKDASKKDLYTVLALGTGHFDVQAGGDLNLESILNPTMFSQGVSQMPAIGTTLTAPKTYLFTYGDTSGVSLNSLSGDVMLQNSGGGIFYQATTARTNAGAASTGYTEIGTGFFRVPQTTNIGVTTVYPGSLQVSAFGGSINSKSSATLFPSVTGDLKLIAAKDIQLGLIMSDAVASAFQANAVVTNPNTQNLPAFASLMQSMLKGYGSMHAQDAQPVIISAGGNIGGMLTIPKAGQIEAGKDILNLGLVVQNLKSSDTTSIVAGRDIAYVAPANSSASMPGISVAGPGQVVLQAGRNVDLGQSVGVVTNGNLSNVLLPEQGADVTVLAGVGQGSMDTQAFIDKYIDPAAGKSYGADLISYVGSYAAAPQNRTVNQAFTTFNTLSKSLQDAFVRQVFFSELKSSGRNAVTTKNYQTGLDAIATLFPSASYKGDVNLYYSQIKTLRGGDINIFTPGGGVNAGLANPPSTGPQKKATELGIVTVKGGDVKAFVNKDFMVNQSRVFTLQGGDILMWSSNGDIDAGKGSKSVSATPPPLLVVDLATGTFNVDTSGSVVGSGIAVLLANKDVVAGSIDLIAPKGTVNAGDAGIRSAGDIFLAASQVIGADNISFGGAGAGVPVAPPPPVSVGIGTMQEASTAAGQATQGLGGDMANMKEKLAGLKPSFLSVEVIGLGDEGMDWQP